MSRARIFQVLALLIAASFPDIAFTQEAAPKLSALATPAANGIFKISNGYAARLEYRLSETGPADCRTIITSGDLEVDAASCKLFTDLRHSPESPVPAELVGSILKPTVYWQRDNAGVLRRCCSYLTTGDYPDQELQGAVKTKYTIGVDGQLKDCIIVQSSGHEILDSTVCRLIMRRARFNPAKDEEGRPVESSFEYNARWGSHETASAPSE